MNWRIVAIVGVLGGMCGCGSQTNAPPKKIDGPPPDQLSIEQLRATGLDCIKDGNGTTPDSRFDAAYCRALERALNERTLPGGRDYKVPKYKVMQGQPPVH